MKLRYVSKFNGFYFLNPLPLILRTLHSPSLYFIKWGYNSFVTREITLLDNIKIAMLFISFTITGQTKSMHLDPSPPPSPPTSLLVCTDM